MYKLAYHRFGEIRTAIPFLMLLKNDPPPMYVFCDL